MDSVVDGVTDRGGVGLVECGVDSTPAGAKHHHHPGDRCHQQSGGDCHGDGPRQAGDSGWLAERTRRVGLPRISFTRGVG